MPLGLAPWKQMSAARELWRRWRSLWICWWSIGTYQGSSKSPLSKQCSTTWDQVAGGEWSARLAEYCSGIASQWYFLDVFILVLSGSWSERFQHHFCTLLGTDFYRVLLYYRTLVGLVVSWPRQLLSLSHEICDLWGVSDFIPAFYFDYLLEIGLIGARARYNLWRGHVLLGSGEDEGWRGVLILTLRELTVEE